MCPVVTVITSLITDVPHFSIIQVSFFSYSCFKISLSLSLPPPTQYQQFLLCLYFFCYPLFCYPPPISLLLYIVQTIHIYSSTFIFLPASLFRYSNLTPLSFNSYHSSTACSSLPFLPFYIINWISYRPLVCLIKRWVMNS